jgi:hypothetical protein
MVCRFDFAFFVGFASPTSLAPLKIAKNKVAKTPPHRLAENTLALPPPKYHATFLPHFATFAKFTKIKIAN